ncbi:hypothetical protein JCM10212_003781 [Sporobolomyces blumeae]
MVGLARHPLVEPLEQAVLAEDILFVHYWLSQLRLEGKQAKAAFLAALPPSSPIVIASSTISNPDLAIRRAVISYMIFSFFRVRIQGGKAPKRKSTSRKEQGAVFVKGKMTVEALGQLPPSRSVRAGFYGRTIGAPKPTSLAAQSNAYCRCHRRTSKSCSPSTCTTCSDYRKQPRIP